MLCLLVGVHQVACDVIDRKDEIIAAELGLTLVERQYLLPARVAGKIRRCYEGKQEQCVIERASNPLRPPLAPADVLAILKNAKVADPGVEPDALLHSVAKSRDPPRLMRIVRMDVAPKPRGN